MSDFSDTPSSKQMLKEVLKKPVITLDTEKSLESYFQRLATRTSHKVLRLRQNGSSSGPHG